MYISKEMLFLIIYILLTIARVVLYIFLFIKVCKGKKTSETTVKEVLDKAKTIGVKLLDTFGGQFPAITNLLKSILSRDNKESEDNKDNE